jgi:hypothetical protein
LQQPADNPADTAPPPAKTVVLTLDDEPNSADDREPEQVLQDQLSTLEPSADPAVDPSATILYVERADETITDSQWIRVLDAVEQAVRGQLRRDRHVLSFSIGEFIWLTGDTPVEDALLPAERIRQVLANTQYQSGEQPLPVRVATAVVQVAPHDDTQQLLFRLRQAVEFSGSQPAPHTAIDQGDGPEPTQPIDLQVSERTQPIDA